MKRRMGGYHVWAKHFNGFMSRTDSPLSRLRSEGIWRRLLKRIFYPGRPTLFEHRDVAEYAVGKVIHLPWQWPKKIEDELRLFRLARARMLDEPEREYRFDYVFRVPSFGEYRVTDPTGECVIRADQPTSCSYVYWIHRADRDVIPVLAMFAYVLDWHENTSGD
ncbi:MAG TPA: hypothetical protein EYP56_12800 [Planctomycetaceae bacterium]|nr:hypothetical protein [Planctomycetaceae bacterium]HIQ22271.1 hypothetical protein [Planctomycetota bacterium]